MKNTVYKLVGKEDFREYETEIGLNADEVVVHPEYLSICAADQRYFLGRREQAVMKAKLPMALIHEGWGTVVKDNSGKNKPGEKVVMVPNIPHGEDKEIAENYLRSSEFCASSRDGFMQKYVLLPAGRVVKFEDIDPGVASVAELFSVAMHSVLTFMGSANGHRGVIGVWGDGNLGYLTALALKNKLPSARIAVLGIDGEKLKQFTFGVKTYFADKIPEDLLIDHAFECVGGSVTEEVINQIIDIIRPEGTIMLMGVSEKNVALNTRMVLEKGLNLIGRSRSGLDDFIETIAMLDKNQDIQGHVKKIIHSVVDVSSIDDMKNAFESDSGHCFKTVMKWCV